MKKKSHKSGDDSPGNEAIRRVVIENVQPCIDGGKYPVKRTCGETISVTADIFADGHDAIAAVLLFRKKGDEHWQSAAMEPVNNDVFSGAFSVPDMGCYEYAIEAWVDRFQTWRADLIKKKHAGMGIKSESLEGAALLRSISKRANKPDAKLLQQAAIALESDVAAFQAATDDALKKVVDRYPEKTSATRSDSILSVTVERERARFGAWYEFFPRSCAPRTGQHGTFRDAEKRLSYISSMGFDVIYLPPIHPIGFSFRKGPNNSLKAEPNDPGSPWAIGAAEGGHKSIHPALGTMEDFDRLVQKVQASQMEVALDLAYQCSPDHPYVREHPQWFRHRPDGTIKYAENPPKKYQDIYPLDFECEDWRNLWIELRDIVLFWIRHGVHIFRVDNPHTKSFRFWEWLISTVREQHPEAIFLSEAFTRPKVMRHLAKIGFSQSYTYFTWRNTKAELTEYMKELTQTELREYLRPNFFANTPDILHEYLQFGGRAAFQIRLVLAATLGASYGIYGPAFELCENRAIAGTEEYIDSEKYQIRSWNLNDPGSLKAFITRLNFIRRENPALQFDRGLTFHETDNEQIICYSKATGDLSNMILVAVNLDPHHVQSGWVRIPATRLNRTGIPNYQVHDLLTDARYLWHGEVNYLELNPAKCPAHVFRVRRKIKTEHDFDYYL